MISELRKQLKARNSQAHKYLELIPESQWPKVPSPPLRVWRSRDFLVQEYLDSGQIRISVIDSRELKAFKNDYPMFGNSITWDELQQIKTEIGYGDRCAVEIYPPDHLIVKDCNMRHLWILEETPRFVWGAAQ